MVFMTLAVDQIEQSVVVVGFAKTMLECRNHASRVTTPYVKTFEFNDGLGSQINIWLQSCGVPSRESAEAIRGIGRELETWKGN